MRQQRTKIPDLTEMTKKKINTVVYIMIKTLEKKRMRSG